jgi:uncharacterized integral membrane protein
MTDQPVVPSERSPEKKTRVSATPQVVRLVGFLALCGIIAAFVIQNSQDVAVKFWFLTRHPPLIFVVVGCLVVGGLGGYIAGRRRGESRVRRRLRRRVEPEL